MSSGKDSHIIETIKEYGRGLLSFIRRRVKSDADAEDILQDVWHQFCAVVNAEPIEQTGAWLFRVARNKIIDRHKKKSEQLFTESVTEEEETFSFKEIMMVDNATPETEYLRNVFWKQFFAALEELPEEQRQVYLWHELEGLSFADIAVLTGENTGTLISRKRYAVLHLRNRLRLLRDEILIY
ncbi:RNA polymerase sigma factor [Arcticibacter tournemirensis]|uniref:Sigma-70 family RNA polymerase sigma factor n=1 Tax=Arcticibacter tournemirensis TaxID=699437 RepID=A0A4Q0M7A4_9SPHI|nr:sigma-70 family RNA polymerase sigma factor [Arcticibacter tournemirensis]RXF68904.1 sigma-70 family RNA polymerase sigma factor [Arcticibacter tournemirensis]